jgi:sugar lactone lactonase YvrE
MMIKKSVEIFLISSMIFTACNQTTENSNLEQVFADSTYQLTGVAVSSSGRVFTNYPLWQGAYQYAVVEILPAQKKLPYPNDSMNTWKEGEDGNSKWVCVQAVYIDAANNMWVVDPASPKQKKVYQNSQKLVQINVDSNKVQRIYSLANVTDDQSYINDVRVDTLSQYAYLTNSSEGGIIVLNLRTGNARQVLQGNTSVIADPSYIFKIDGRQVKKGDAIFKSNSDGIALTMDGKYLYYKPLTDDKLYRIQTIFLRDTSLTPAQLSEKIEKLGSFCSTDGMACDKNGNIYLGDLENHRIVQISNDLKMTIFIKDDRLIWPDSYQITDDGYLYISCSQIDRQPDYNEGVNKRTTPYCIYRIKLSG